jgi:hypothetical protein
VPSRNVSPNLRGACNICTTYRTILVIPIIQKSGNPDIQFSEILTRSLSDVIVHEEHASGLYLNLQRRMGPVRESFSLRPAESCFDAIVANGGSRATASRRWRRP